MQFSAICKDERPFAPPKHGVFFELVQTPANSYTRAKMCNICKNFGQFAGIDVTFITKDLRGTYSRWRSAPRDLPDDVKIEKWFHLIPNKDWQWVYGIIAAFGLRPHEIFHLDMRGLEQGGDVLIVLDGTKTGYREVRPLHPEWIDKFNLRQRRLPNIEVAGKANRQLGKK